MSETDWGLQRETDRETECSETATVKIYIIMNLRISDYHTKVVLRLLCN